MAAEGFCGANPRCITALAKDLSNCLQLLNVPCWRTGPVSVDVVDLTFDGCHGLLHAADGTFARGRHHVVTVTGCPITNDFGVDFCPSGFGMIQ